MDQAEHHGACHLWGQTKTDIRRQPGRRCLLPTAAARLLATRKRTGSDPSGASVSRMDSEDPIKRTYEALVANALALPWTRSPGVLGFGIGVRSTNGQGGAERCLKVFVDRKRPLSTLSDPVPRSLRLTDCDETVSVDVEALPRLVPHGATLASRQADAPRNAIRADRPDAPWGSYGFLLRHRFDGRSYLLGSGHVLASGAAPAVGDGLVLSDQDRRHRTAARLTAWTTPLPSDDGYPNVADAAIAEIDHPRAVDRLSWALPTGLSGDIRSGMHLRLAGAASGTQPLTVLCERATLAVDMALPGLGRRRVGFRDQVLCRGTSQPGDSGAGILNDRGRAVGLHTWGPELAPAGASGDLCGFTPITTVLETLTRNRELDLITEADVITMPLDRPPVDDLDDAIDLVARTLYGEARREPPETRLAIAEVVYNRALQRSPRFGMSVEAVCRQPDQFSCWNPGDPNRNRTLSISLRDPEIADCVTIARDLVAGRVGGLTLGADHYHHRRVSPYYSREHAPCAQIGNYLFFNDIS